MQYKPLVFLFVVIAIVYFIGSSGCANIGSPTGGPRDSLPPVLLKTAPLNPARNFTGNRIMLTFNEYVNLDDNAQQNLVVSPTPKINPNIERKLHTVTVKLKDTLEKNTTYAIQFGNAIKDVNEGNVFRGFTYVFSTGNTIDSNTLSGKVLLAETGKTDSTLIAVLYVSADDSAVVKERPRYYAKLDSSGNFHFRFLARGTYHLYAMKDEGGMKKYTSKSQLFAFADKPVVITDSTSSVVLYAYNIKEETKPLAPLPAVKTSKPKKDEKNPLKFLTNKQGDQLDLLGDFVITFEDSLKIFDTSKVVLTDEKFTRLGGYTIKGDSTHHIYTLKYPWKAGTAYRLILDKDFASDSLGRKLLKTDTIPFNVKSEDAYGSVKLNFTNLDLKNNPVLQLVQNDKIEFSQSLTSAVFYRKLFKPGDYDIRILYDTNGNGVWDPGDFFGKHLQPERVMYIAKKLIVKTNWDNEVTVALSK